MNERTEIIQCMRKRKNNAFTNVKKIGKGKPCEQNQQCCLVSGQKIFPADKFNQKIRVNGEVVFVMTLTNEVDNGCVTNQGRVTMTFTPATVSS